MSKKTITSLFIGYFFFGISSLFSQTNSEVTQPLALILSQIESEFNVTFTYADANINTIEISSPEQDLTLNEILDYLQSETGLLFQLISDTNIVVRIDTLTDITTTQFLEEVVVMNYLTKGISLKPDGITQFKPKQFGILPGLIEPDVLQSIQALPGVMSVDERVSNLNVRGGTHDQNLILWDGIKMYQSGHFFGLISAFSPYLTETVKVSKNGTSAMYGDGVSSIIDMQNSKTLQHDFSGGIGLNLISADGFAKIPIGEKNELQIASRRSMTDWFTTPTYDQYFKRIFQDTDVTNQNNSTISQNQNFYFYDTSLKWLLNISNKDKISVNAVTIYNNLDYDEQSTINDVNETLNSNLVQFNLAGSIDYRRQWNENLKTSAQFYVSHYNLDATNFNITNQQRLIQENQVIDSGLKLHANYQIEENLNYFGGYQFIEVGISNLEDVDNPEFRRYTKEVLRTHSLFNEFKFSSNSRNTSVRLGLRNTYIEKFDEFIVEPRLSISQKFLKYFRFEILGELKSQTTTQIIDLQNDFLGVEKRRWILANNSTIPIVKSKQISLGIHYNKKNLIMSAEGYSKDVEGITSRSQGFQNQYQFVNAIGSFRISGIDFLINKKFEAFSTWLSYSYSVNNYTFSDLNNGEAFPNNADIRHSLRLASSYSFNNFKLAIGANWRSGKPFTDFNSTMPIANNSINYNSPNANNLEDYLRVDLSATYTFTLGRSNAIVGLSLWNLLNAQTTINSYYTLSDDNNISKIENQSLGITPNLSFRFHF